MVESKACRMCRQPVPRPSAQMAGVQEGSRECGRALMALIHGVLGLFGVGRPLLARISPLCMTAKASITPEQSYAAIQNLRGPRMRSDRGGRLQDTPPGRIRMRRRRLHAP